MPPAQQETPAEKTDAKESVFRRDLGSLGYDDIPLLRQQVLDFVATQNLPPAYTAALPLTFTEILTNIVRHPADKAQQVQIRLRVGANHLLLDIADDSSPFASFDAKCKRALQSGTATETLRENGYGLACILQQHAQVTYTPAAQSPDGLNHFRVMDKRDAGQGPPKAAAKRARIFMVDDDDVALNTYCQMLKEDYDVITFSTAAAAVQAFSQDKPDLVISDLHMPDMDGTDLRRALAVLPGGDMTPFIFLSARAESAHSTYINALGVDDFLCKPVEPHHLQSIVARLIRRAQQVRAALEGQFHADLNRHFKPALPARFSDWRIVTLNRMAEAGGGDFTLHRQSAAALDFILADVMGHGAKAKFFAYAYAGYLRSLFRQDAAAPEDPAAFLMRLSRAIDGDDLLESIIMTCQSFQLLPDGQVGIASAGHPCPALIHADGTAEMLEVAGPLPALISEPQYVLKTIKLKPGEKILCATDGFLQVFEDKATVGGLLPYLKEPQSASQVAAMLWDSFLKAETKAGIAADDATLIIAEYGGMP